MITMIGLVFPAGAAQRESPRPLSVLSSIGKILLKV
jgi:hypothetical protein